MIEVFSATAYALADLNAASGNGNGCKPVQTQSKEKYKEDFYG